MIAYCAILGYLAALYLQPGIKFPALAPFRPLIVLGLLAMISGTVYLMRRQGRPLILGGQMKQMFIILAFMGLSGVFAYIKLTAYDAWFAFAKVVLFTVFLVNVVDSLPKFKGLLYALIVIHVGVGLEGLQGFYTESDRADRKGLKGTLSNFLGDTNDYSLAVNVIIPYAYFLGTAAQTRLARWSLFGCVGLLTVASMFTFSRGGFLTLLVLSLHFVVKTRRRFGLMAIGVVLMVVVAAVVPQTYWDRIETIGSFQEDNNAQSRFWAWKAGWNMAVDNPLLGMGPGNFVTGYRVKYKPPEARNRTLFTAHSVYFQIMGELGFVGLVLLIALIISSFKAQRAILAREPAEFGDPEDARFIRAAAHAAQASLLAFLVGGALLSAAYYPHLWFNAAFTLILTHIAKERAERVAPAAQTAELDMTPVYQRA
ncbi:MAG: putative O-glycosylation ligase, exosortase A system-associated [Nitrospirota bacterium]